MLKVREGREFIILQLTATAEGIGLVTPNDSFDNFQIRNEHIVTP
jgi:hypothetical protein